MKKRTTLIILSLILFLFVVSLGYLYNKNKQSPTYFDTETPIEKVIVTNTIATGNIVPKEEVVIKPNISGIVDAIYVEAGQKIKMGDLIAKIKVIPNVSSISNAKNRLKDAKVSMENQEKNYKRQKSLFDKQVISKRDLETADLTYKQSKINYASAIENLEIIQTGTTKSLGSSSNTTLVRSTVTGMILEVPIKEGNQVIEANNFNEGTTIATLADVNHLIFQGNIDESEVGKVKEGMPVDIIVGAIPDTTFAATLDYIAPKGILINGAVQFEIKGTLDKTTTFIRSGLSANASIIIDQTEGPVLSIGENLLQYDEDQKPFVEIQIKDQNFEKRYLTIGISDGFFIEVKDGIKKDDNIKVWSASKEEEKNRKRRRKKI